MLDEIASMFVSMFAQHSTIFCIVLGRNRRVYVWFKPWAVGIRVYIPCVLSGLSLGVRENLEKSGNFFLYICTSIENNCN